MTSVCCPLAVLVQSKPPTPPSMCLYLCNAVISLTHIEIAYAGSQPSPPVHKTLLAWIGKGANGKSNMSGTERLDFTILVILFGVLVAAVSTFSIFTNQIFVSSRIPPKQVR